MEDGNIWSYRRWFW